MGIASRACPTEQGASKQTLMMTATFLEHRKMWRIKLSGGCFSVLKGMLGGMIECSRELNSLLHCNWPQSTDRIGTGPIRVMIVLTNPSEAFLYHRRNPEKVVQKFTQACNVYRYRMRQQINSEEWGVYFSVFC